MCLNLPTPVFLHVKLIKRTTLPWWSSGTQHYVQTLRVFASHTLPRDQTDDETGRIYCSCKEEKKIKRQMEEFDWPGSRVPEWKCVAVRGVSGELLPVISSSVHVFGGMIIFSEVFLRPPTVGIICFVVHHQLVVHKVEAVRLRLIRMLDHLTHCKTRT